MINILGALDKHAPHAQKLTKLANKPWISKGILVQIQNKQRISREADDVSSKYRRQKV